MGQYATIADIESRYPAELVLLAADEATGLVDEVRVEAALQAADADIHAILFGRYQPAELARLDAASRIVLTTYAVDIGLYRVALSFSRSNERVKQQRDAAIERLTAIATGKGGLSFEPSGGGDVAGGGSVLPGSIGPNEVVLVGPERVLTRDRMRGL